MKDQGKLRFTMRWQQFTTRWQLTAFLAAVFFFAQAAPALGFGFDWDITSFSADISIKQDSSIIVTETIVADYTRERHHGIFRYIPVKYRDRFGNKLSLRFKVLSVTDENGRDWQYEQTWEGDNVYLKIGDPEVYLNEPATFRIMYQVDRAVTFFDDHDEVYWNATGTEWDVPMREVAATVTLPDGIKNSDIRSTCYTGSYGSAEQNCKPVTENAVTTFTVPPAAATRTASGPDLQPREGLTIVVGFPKGMVTPPTALQQIIWFLSDNWGYILPLITLAVLYYIWHTRGRDPAADKTAIMPIYKPPDGLTPTEIGTIIDESADVRDISSAIIDLAVRGYLKIIETKEKKFLFESVDYTFEKLKEYESDSTLHDHEKKILRAVFDGESKRNLDDLNNKFYKDLTGIKTQIYSQLVSKGYFPFNPEKIRGTYNTIGFVLLFGVIFFLGFWINFFSISAPIGIAVSGILFFIFAPRMPAKTKKGAEAYIQIRGLEEYIRTAEKDRIKFQEKENIFEKLLPYAMTLGLAAKWTTAFEGIYKTPPAWYVSSDPYWHSNFSTRSLNSRLDAIGGKMQSTFVSSPRSASGGGSGFGGGFSGGGFGGGGGGSW